MFESIKFNEKTSILYILSLCILKVERLLNFTPQSNYQYLISEASKRT